MTITAVWSAGAAAGSLALARVAENRTRLAEGAGAAEARQLLGPSD